jgi:HYR domain
VITPGPYSISVVAKDVGQDARTIGAAVLNVEALPVDGPPLISSTEVVYEEARNSEGAVVNFDVTAQNPNGDPVPVACTPSSGSQFSMGTTPVTCTATNSFGTTTARIVVVVADSTNPIVTVPANIVSTSSVVTFETSAIDNIDGPLPVTCDHASGSTFDPGVTEVVCTATDSNFNTGVNSFLVRLSGGEPVVTVPGDITVTSADGGAVVVPYTATATNAEVDCLPSGHVFTVGTTVVTCTATNLTGSDSKSFRIRVVSGLIPEITVPADITVEATSGSGASVSFVVTATNDGVVACTPTSGSTFPLGQTTVNCTATNVGGTATGSFKVTVRDTTPPVLTLPATINAEATSASGAVVTYVATAIDLVDGSVSVQCAPASGSTFALGTTTVSCSAHDTRGNTRSGSFTVRVADNTPPQILSVQATPGTLWPPNHKMSNITVAVVAVDAVDSTPVSHIISVTSNQPVNGTGDGDTDQDWIITGPLTVQLRSERSHGVDRVYTITISTVDDAGNTATATDTVVVSQGKHRAVR